MNTGSAAPAQPGDPGTRASSLLSANDEACPARLLWGAGGGAWQVLSLVQRCTGSAQNLWRVRRKADCAAFLLFQGLRLCLILMGP